MVLVDTSVWIRHLRSSDPGLVKLLTEGAVLMHPFVHGELACGNLANRKSVLHYLDELPDAKAASHQETMNLMDLRKLSGRGIGWVDAHLVASALLTNCELWTHDERLKEAAGLAGARRYLAAG